MKGPNLGLMILAAVLLLFAIGGSAYAFHSGGVAECVGCHSMHSPQDSTVGALLINSDQSSTCLSCHLAAAGTTAPSSYHVATADADMPTGKAPIQRTPGGDFGWLHKTYTFTVRGTVNTETGDSHGHNIIAADFGYTKDATNSTAPGGTFPSSQLACNSCHDQHGKMRRLSDGSINNAGGPIIASGSYNNSPTPAAGQAVGVYRLLRGNLSSTATAAAGANYPGVPAAVAPSTYNQSEATNQVRVAYGVATGANQSTWGHWCGTCHPNMHSTGNYVHPVDQMLSTTLLANYNAYVSSGVMTGTAAKSFLSLVPFTTNKGDFTSLAGLANNNSSNLNGPVSGDQVNCLSCHRAHASGFPNGLRWASGGEFLTYVDGSGNPAWPGTDTTPSVPQFAMGRLGAETMAAYYDRPVTTFGAYQRALCNKCHAQD